MQDYNNTDNTENLKNWFIQFEQALKELYNCSKLKLKRDSKNLSFYIEMPGYEPFGLNQLAHGYSAFLDIYAELLMRFETKSGCVDYDHEAIVIIDEIEIHLHVELQKRIMPFLTRMFPSVQFIVSTHSPFVINSLNNAIVFDLEKRISLNDASLYSYDEIIEGFYDANKNSDKVRKNIERYKYLRMNKRNEQEDREMINIRADLERISPANAELYLSFTIFENGIKEND
jgi:predicted ATPase